MSSEIRFYGKDTDYYIFSNYCPTSFTLNGIEYDNVEKYFQSQKFEVSEGCMLEKEDTHYYQMLIVHADTPQKVKDLGNQKVNYRGEKWLINKKMPCLGALNDNIREYKNKVTIRRDWDKVKEDVMLEGLKAKFTQNNILLQILLSTGDSKIIEDSPRDWYWGCGSDGEGLNRLGALLIKLRSEYI